MYCPGSRPLSTCSSVMSSAVPRLLLPRNIWNAPFPSSYAVIHGSLINLPTSLSEARVRRRTATSQAHARKDVNASKSLRRGRIIDLSSPHGSWSPILSSTVIHRRPFHTTPPLYRDHHFDTLKFVQRLKDEGFSEDQATAMMRVLSDVIEESIQNLTRTMVLREGMSPVSRLIYASQSLRA